MKSLLIEHEDERTDSCGLISPGPLSFYIFFFMDNFYLWKEILIQIPNGLRIKTVFILISHLFVSFLSTS